jgi:hypothetical protein
VKGGFPGDGNIDDDPRFKKPADGDFHLRRYSPCINRGIYDGAPLEDIDGELRPYMGTVDMGADEFTEGHALEADVFSISEASGGTVNFLLRGSLKNFGRNYILLGTLSGTVPGTPLPGGKEMLRLNWDALTDLMLLFLNTPVCMNFLGTLDISGFATAQLNAPSVPGLAGFTMHYAYCLNNPFNYVSNPVAIEVVP